MFTNLAIQYQSLSGTTAPTPSLDNLTSDGAGQMFRQPVDALIQYLDDRWANRSETIRETAPDAAFSRRPQGWGTTTPSTGMPTPRLPVGLAFPAMTGATMPKADWHHLVYAYLIENTRAVEIFGRVLWCYAHGEQLDVASTSSQDWIRATESLFFRDPPSSSVMALRSELRPDSAASRRNAYFRMFGFDLAFGKGDTPTYPYERAAHHNADFTVAFETFLAEAWRGVTNAKNISGVNVADPEGLRVASVRLRDMLSVRRRGHTLQREEFAYVALASWIHTTLLFDSDIVVDLKATAPSPADRLTQIGRRINLPAHPRSAALFKLAEPMSVLLLLIESGLFDDIGGARAISSEVELQNLVLTVINHWSDATQRDLKTAVAVPGVATGGRVLALR